MRIVAAPLPGPGEQDIVEVVGRYTVLRPFGESQLRGACPFSRSQALRVRPAFGTFHCFRCGVGGDAGAFAVKITDVTNALPGPDQSL
ncbi:DNA primase [Alloactinosynnema sp. L-07]|uniref:CHC2 zinc finger domain-containing protein n=1 Tax=Alloactinosynnema sp. L-07 TaxID=1653480 RepID=UPI00065F0392|nr:CHC2 zinc finger domain-containing protein [Alloactinosynnema sp. L-07]CRK57042.1 DNA primase [Alloactinosynnema sp. L-07]